MPFGRRPDQAPDIEQSPSASGQWDPVRAPDANRLQGAWRAAVLLVISRRLEEEQGLLSLLCRRHVLGCIGTIAPRDDGRINIDGR